MNVSSLRQIGGEQDLDNGSIVRRELPIAYMRTLPVSIGPLGTKGSGLPTSRFDILTLVLSHLGWDVLKTDPGNTGLALSVLQFERCEVVPRSLFCQGYSHSIDVCRKWPAPRPQSYKRLTCRQLQLGVFLLHDTSECFPDHGPMPRMSSGSSREGEDSVDDGNEGTWGREEDDGS